MAVVWSSHCFPTRLQQCTHLNSTIHSPTVQITATIRFWRSVRHRTHSLEGVSYHNAVPENNGQTMHPLEQLHSNILILYYKARSILPKLDCLRAEAAVTNPSIICIVETWLSDNISDREISIENYQIVRVDQNKHGGGVLASVHS